MNGRARSRFYGMRILRLAGVTLGRLALAALGALASLSALSHTPPDPAVPVAITWLSAGGVLTLTARTEKRGAACKDSWSVSPSLALTAATVLEDGGASRERYVSTARVSVLGLASDTTYTFSYSIVMTANGAAWAGSDSVAITTGTTGAITTGPAGAFTGLR